MDLLADLVLLDNTPYVRAGGCVGRVIGSGVVNGTITSQFNRPSKDTTEHAVLLRRASIHLYIAKKLYCSKDVFTKFDGEL